MDKDKERQGRPNDAIRLRSGNECNTALLSVVHTQVRNIIDGDCKQGLNEVALNAWDSGWGYYQFSGIAKLVQDFPDVKTWFEEDGRVKQSVADIIKCLVVPDLSAAGALLQIVNPLPSESDLRYGPSPVISPFENSISTKSMLDFRRGKNPSKPF